MIFEIMHLERETNIIWKEYQANLLRRFEEAVDEYSATFLRWIPWWVWRLGKICVPTQRCIMKSWAHDMCTMQCCQQEAMHAANKTSSCDQHQSNVARRMATAQNHVRAFHALRTGITRASLKQTSPSALGVDAIFTTTHIRIAVVVLIEMIIIGFSWATLSSQSRATQQLYYMAERYRAQLCQNHALILAACIVQNGQSNVQQEFSHLWTLWRQAFLTRQECVRPCYAKNDHSTACFHFDHVWRYQIHGTLAWQAVGIANDCTVYAHAARSASVVAFACGSGACWCQESIRYMKYANLMWTQRLFMMMAIKGRARFRRYISNIRSGFYIVTVGAHDTRTPYNVLEGPRYPLCRI